jgi:peptide/nickel transport system permease protein
MTETLRGNRPLFIGLCLLAVFVVTAILGPFLAPYSPQTEKPLIFHGSTPVVAPAPPDQDHWFGTDPRGRDMFSLMLYGLRHTLAFVAIVALVRVSIGGWIGIWLGMKQKKGEESPTDKKKDIFSITGLFGSVPTIILLIILFSLPTKLFSYWSLVLIQGMVLVLFGVPPIAATIRGHTGVLKNRLSVLASKVMGATKGWLIRKHIFPMLKETFILLFIQDMILVLNILGQLSLFKIFLGGTEVKQFDDIKIEYYSRSFEWVGLMGQNKAWVVAHPYLIWIPLFLYMMLLLAFFLISKGLENRYLQMYNKHPHV